MRHEKGVFHGKPFLPAMLPGKRCSQVPPVHFPVEHIIGVFDIEMIFSPVSIEDNLVVVRRFVDKGEVIILKFIVERHFVLFVANQAADNRFKG